MLLANGVETLDLGQTNWRVAINNTLAIVITTTSWNVEMAKYSLAAHTHGEYYFPNLNEIETTDLPNILLVNTQRNLTLNSGQYLRIVGDDGNRYGISIGNGTIATVSLGAI